MSLGQLLMSVSWSSFDYLSGSLRYTLLNSASFIKDLLRVRGDGEPDILFESELPLKLSRCLNLVIDDMRAMESDYRRKYPDAPLYLYFRQRSNRNIAVVWRLSKKHSSTSNELVSKLSKSWFMQYLSVFDSVFVEQVERYDLQRLRLNMIYSSLSHQIRLLEKYQ